MTVLTPLQLTQAGFNQDQIAYWIENQRPILKAAGFTDFEINDAFKIKPKKPILNSDFDDNEANISTEHKAPFPDGELKLEKEKIKDAEKTEQIIEEKKDKDEQPDETSVLSVEQENTLANLEAKEILTGKTDNKFSAAVYNKQSQKIFLEEKEKKLVKELKEGKFEYYILNTPLTTGAATRKMLSWAMEHYGWDEKTANIWNTYISFISAIESNNRNVYNKSGNAKGLFQFTDGSLVTALNRYIAINKQLDPNYEMEDWVIDALEHRDGTALEPEQQRAVTMANFFMMARSDRLNRDGTDGLIERIATGDVDAMKELYLSYHHAEWKQTVPQLDTWELKTNQATIDRVNESFAYWNTANVGFENPVPSMFGTDTILPDNLAWIMGGKGNRTAVTTGYLNSMHGMFDQYVGWRHEHPEFTAEEHDDILKSIFMWQNQRGFEGFTKEVIAGATTMINDMPYMVAGCMGASKLWTLTAVPATGGYAAPLTPLVCMGTAFALPEVIRHSFSEGLIDGKVNDFDQWMSHFLDVKTAVVGAKMFGLGSATALGGTVTQKLAKSKYLKWSDRNAMMARLSSEVYIMTDLGARLNGQVPTLKDFAHTAILIGGFHASIGMTKNMINIYKQWGVHPKDLWTIAEAHPEVKFQLMKNVTPDFLLKQQRELLQELERIKNTRLLPPPKFNINEKVNISMEGTEQGIIISKQTIDGRLINKVKLEDGQIRNIDESQIRKLDPEANIKVDIKNDGSLDVIPTKVKNDKEPPKGSKDDFTSFPEKQKNGEFSKDIIEIKRENKKIVNADGTKYTSTVVQAINDLGITRTKVVTADGKMSSDGHLAVVNKFYPKINAEFNKKTKAGTDKYTVKSTFKTADELINKVFKGLTKKYQKVSVVFAAKKGVDSNIDVLVGRINNEYVSFSRKAYEQLIKFTENGVEKKAKLVAKDKDSPLIFLHPETNNVIAMLMPRRLNKNDTLYKEADTYWEQHADKGASTNFHYSKRTRDTDNVGIPNDPYFANETTKGYKADWKKLFESGQGLDFYSIVTLVETLLGKMPKLKETMGGDYIGVFKHLRKQDKKIPLRKQAEIEVLRSLQENPAEFLKTLTHELGHLIDFVPARSMAHGNILGHIANLKKFLNDWIAGKNDGAKPLSKIEQKVLKKQAEQLAKLKQKETESEIKELKIKPETILQIFNDPKAREKIDPEFYDAFAKLAESLKKQVVKDAMKGLMSHHMRVIADKINGKKVDFKLSEEANKIFAKLFEREIQNRGLVNVEMIRKELKSLSKEWHPWDRATATKKYREYRDSPNELMAEFMMAWLLRPQWTKVNAPKSFDLLMYYLKNRPEVMDLYVRIQNQLNAPKDVRDAQIAMETKDMFMGGEKKLRKKYQELANKEKHGFDDIGTEVIDKMWFMLQQLKLDGMRGNSWLAKKLDYYMGHYNYKWTEGSLYHRLLNYKIMKKMVDLNYNKHDFGYMMFLMHMAKSKQREGKVTWKFYKMPKALEEKFKKEEGDIKGKYTRYAMEHPELVKLVDKYFEFSYDYAIKRIIESKVFSPELNQKMKDNPFYLTFKGLEELVKEMEFKGKNFWASKGIKKTEGMFEEIVNPLDATVAKHLSLLADIKRQVLYRHVVTFLKKHKKLIEEGLSTPVISKPKMIKMGKNLVLDPNRPANTKRVSYQWHGKWHTYDIASRIVEGFESNPLYQWQVIKISSGFNSIQRGIYTEHNPLFWAANWGWRDKKRSFIMLPNGKKTRWMDLTNFKNRAKYVKLVFESLNDAHKSLYKEGTEITREMEQKGFMIAPEVGYRGEAGMELYRKGMTEEDFYLKKFVWEQYESKNLMQELHGKTTGKLLHHSGQIARVLERSHKIAGYKLITQMIKEGKLDMTMEELHKVITGQIGSPNFLRQGKANPVLNTVFLFFNANKEGWRGDWQGIKRDPKLIGWDKKQGFTTGTTGNFIIHTFIPKVFQKMMMYGAFGWAYAELYNAVPEYDRDNYNVYPLFWTSDDEGNKRPFYFRSPLDFTSQLVGSILSKSFDMSFGINKDMSWTEKAQQFWRVGGNNLPQVTTWITIMTEVSNLMSGNPIVNRYNHPVFDEGIQKSNWSDNEHLKLWETLKYMWNQYGMSWIYESKAKFKNEAIKDFENITGIPILVDPLISRFFKVGDNPIVSKYHENKKLEDKLLTSTRVKAKLWIDKALSGRVDEITEEERIAITLTSDLADNEYLLRTILNAGEVSELLQELLMADAKEREMIIISIEQVLAQKNKQEIDKK